MVENESSSIQIQTVASESLSTIIKAEIDSAVATARAFPRSLKVFQDRAMSMATFNEDIAASCSYAVPRDGKSIEGPSVRLAEIICSSFGNIRAGSRVISNDGKIITAQGICHDLETNNCVTVEVQRSILKKNGQQFSESLQVTVGNAACAIAYRNAVFKVVPAALCQDIYDKAKEVARGTAETLVKRRDKAVEYFKSLTIDGKPIKDAQICEVLGIKKVEDIDLDKLSILTGMKSAIKNGEDTVASLFEKKKDAVSLDDLKELFEMKKDSPTLSPAKLTDYNRIINSKEATSYEKMYKELGAL